MKEKKSSYFTATWKMLAAVIIGGIAGGVSVVIYELMKKGIDAGIRTINGTIQQYIFPALIIIAVVTVVVGEYSLYRLKNVYKEMKDADEDRFYELDYEEEKWGAWTSGVNLVSQVACIIILSFGYSLKLSLIHISEPTRRTPISYAVFCLKKKKKTTPNPRDGLLSLIPSSA